ncbi:hypothetical protein GCM10009801_41860 [Streptomyces albiaxialis]|uniref:Secreted protein n=1 Tax=Streptomyces albiaxialis TaxID=329523 RepID=A0ABP5HTV7_9ACTN
MSRPLPPPGGRRGPGSRSRGRLSPVVLAGWLFADLLLVLVVVTMADRSDPLAAEPTPKKSGSASASPSPSPTPTGPRSVERGWKEFDVSGRSEKSLVRQIRKDTDRWSGRTAAIVLTFGGTIRGEVYARKVNRLLPQARPRMFDKKDTATDDFHNTGKRADSATVRVYFYTAPK